jgi:acyl-CoA thioesterase
MPDSTKQQLTQDSLAALVARVETEPIAAFLKLKVIEISRGYARVALKMRPEFQNFNGMIFGGIITAVIDHSFALATNSLILPSLASQLNVHFIAAVNIEDELTAECRVLKSGRRVGISEMSVTNQDGKLIARATGTTIPMQGVK